jgi:hypothetical protein
MLLLLGKGSPRHRRANNNFARQTASMIGLITDATTKPFLESDRRCSVIADLSSGGARVLFEPPFMPSAGTTLLRVTKWRMTCRCLSLR